MCAHCRCDLLCLLGLCLCFSVRDGDPVAEWRWDRPQGHLALFTEAASKLSLSQTIGRAYGMEPSQPNVEETGLLGLGDTPRTQGGQRKSFVVGLWLVLMAPLRPPGAGV